MKRLQRIFSLLLVLALCAALIPGVYAQQTETPGIELPTEEAEEPAPPTIGATVPPEEPTEKTFTEDGTVNETISEETVTGETENTAPLSDDALSEDLYVPGDLDFMEGSDGMMLATIDSTQGGIMLFNYMDNGDYTTRLNYQVSCTYQLNGTGGVETAYIKNLGWHFARYGGVPYPDNPLYCLEPYRDFGASTSGNTVDRGVTLDGTGTTAGSNVWYALPAARREAIGQILLYSSQMWNRSVSVSTTAYANNPNVPLRIATQFLIYEIVCGLRDPDSFVRNATNECGTSGDIFYNAGVASVPGFTDSYSILEANIQSAKRIPSFTSMYSGSAPVITLTGKETGIFDSNGVLSGFTFSNGNGASFEKIGDTLYITQTGDVSESGIFQASRSVPSAAGSTYDIWYMNGSSYQTTISLASASSGNLTAYFRLKGIPQTGGIRLTKTTEDGQNLSGWKFGIYADSACTNCVSGPYTTDDGGTISVFNLNVGTYYVKELGHTDTAVNAMYACAGNNPQAVTVSAGDTVSVGFQNKLTSGSVTFIKTTNTGLDLGGWRIGVYTDADCTAPVSGSPFVTGEDGSVAAVELKPGTYWAKETGNRYGFLEHEYWEVDQSVRKFEIKPQENREIVFTNTHYGKLKITKSMKGSGSLEGWNFKISAPNGLEIEGSPFVTDRDGTVNTGKLLPGTYVVEELLPEDSPYSCKTENPLTVAVKAGETAEVSFTNALRPARIWIEKVDNTGKHLAGAVFRLEWSADNGNTWANVFYSNQEDVVMGGCSNTEVVDGCLTSNDMGELEWKHLYPGIRYRVTETKAPEGYTRLKGTAFDDTITGKDLDITIRVINNRGFLLPKTGSSSARIVSLVGAIFLMTSLAVIASNVSKKKKR